MAAVDEQVLAARTAESEYQTRLLTAQIRQVRRVPTPESSSSSDGAALDLPLYGNALLPIPARFSVPDRWRTPDPFVIGLYDVPRSTRMMLPSMQLILIRFTRQAGVPQLSDYSVH